MYSFGKQLAALPRSRYGPWAVIAAGETETATAFARHIAANGINIVLAAHGGRADAYTLTMTAGVSVRTTSPDVFTGELAAATDDIEVGLLVCITDEDATGGRCGESALNRLRTLYLTHRFGQRIADRGEGAVIMVKSLAAQSISQGTPLHRADSTFTAGLRDGLLRQDVEVALLDDFVPHRPAMDADDLALMALARLGRQRHRHCLHDGDVSAVPPALRAN
ncbi:short-chain dehydrogenase [Mycobacteroides franklinii]|uniref:Short-chain dehydrogenase n=1 Tax=Mycobacteroides franklinii TaxID=948102 RepID=A0A1S1L950_9MYCO|nr:short-chain dehydrogenase [Mycobacteroides franklinii]OHU22346.1 short-chain dehydrogenase [Mycobacteroides franklinii]ORA57289.1 short-chain dehydrogenase [Mycobacteroides franklinii]TDH25387.1 short-chain dehydrogenase [Mycobacteroides franklinii]